VKASLMRSLRVSAIRSSAVSFSATGMATLRMPPTSPELVE
jgi:hypothetical protein